MRFVIDNINFLHLVIHIIKRSPLEILIANLAILATCKFVLNGSDGMLDNINNSTY